ncbi:hypothetical protein BC830DRAFT_1082964 [Chytriomyces sp. MP71]|nr:hypothetical protein BC830DRAFT_1082964 [Chytriomyces sp. MP71]
MTPVRELWLLRLRLSNLLCQQNMSKKASSANNQDVDELTTRTRKLDVDTFASAKLFLAKVGPMAINRFPTSQKDLATAFESDAQKADANLRTKSKTPRRNQKGTVLCWRKRLKRASFYIYRTFHAFLTEYPRFKILPFLLTLIRDDLKSVKLFFDSTESKSLEADNYLCDREEALEDLIFDDIDIISNSFLRLFSA